MQSRTIAAVAAALVMSAVTVTGSAQTTSARPKITGISHLAVYTSDASATDHYYAGILGAAKMADPENAQGVIYAFSATQYIEVLPLPANAGVNRLDHIAFNTTNADGMRKYLAAKGWKVPDYVNHGTDESRWFAVEDPEGNKVEFVQPSATPATVNAPNAIGHHIIHVGMLVHDRAAEDKFYRDLLDFKPYWFGGMQEGKVDWVSQQVPNGHDWLEYMVTSGPSGTGIPANISQQSLGVLDHFSIGESSVDAAYNVLKSANRLDCKHDQGPKIGRDGKGQFNMYDPDGIRSELMNFHATEKPCCSEFTAQDPSE
jgi:catechol 2,3-dioxygenase-like lactoylglutathione lyase family enzyme